MLVWLTLPFYDFCGFRSVAVNSVYKLQFFTFICLALMNIRLQQARQRATPCRTATHQCERSSKVVEIIDSGYSDGI